MAVEYKGSLPAFTRGAINGVASLDAGGDVPTSQMPASPTFTDITLANGWKILDTAGGVFLRPPGGVGATDLQIGTT